MTFEPGMLVECIDDTFHNWPEWPGTPVGSLDGLRRSSVYTIRSTYISPLARPLVRLSEIIRPLSARGGEPGYDVRRFRPLRSDRLAVFHAMLAPTPEQVAEYDAERIEAAAEDVERAIEALERTWGAG